MFCYSNTHKTDVTETGKKKTNYYDANKAEQILRGLPADRK